MDQKLNDLKFGLLSKYELDFLVERAKRELEQRNAKPGEYFDVIYCNDGCEGFYVKKEDFRKIPAAHLKSYIKSTLTDSSEIAFSVISVEKNEYAQSCARYEWNFGDGSNTEVKEEDGEEEEDFDEERDDDDINNFKDK